VNAVIASALFQCLVYPCIVCAYHLTQTLALFFAVTNHYCIVHIPLRHGPRVWWNINVTSIIPETAIWLHATFLLNPRSWQVKSSLDYLKYIEVRNIGILFQSKEVHQKTPKLTRQQWIIE